MPRGPHCQPRGFDKIEGLSDGPFSEAVVVIASRVGFSLLALACASSPAAASWPADGRAVCTAAVNQSAQVVVADGAGGALLIWQDIRAGSSYDLYAGHVLASGELDGSWPLNGAPVCLASLNQILPKAIPDGAGGALVVWEDLRGGGPHHVYAQHVLASGALDAAWPDSGLQVCADTSGQRNPVLVSDGGSGLIAAWVDGRGIYAQHVLGSGLLDGSWPATGRSLSIYHNSQTLAQVEADGVGGAIVTWHDSHVGGSFAVYAARVLSSGILDSGWPANGRKVSGMDPASLPVLVKDGSGGVLVAWQDTHVAGAGDVYAQHVLNTGYVDPVWPASGLILTAAANVQIAPTIASDGAGGAFVTWQDRRTGTYDIYAAHALSSGANDAAWPVDGLPICTASGDQRTPNVVADGSGGMITTWDDARPGSTYDIYAQRVSASGTLAFPADGLALCQATGNQTGPTLALVSPGLAIVGWGDTRGSNQDIYAMWTAAPNPVAVLPVVPKALSLAAPYPQPATRSTRFTFQLAGESRAQLAIYNLAGRRVRTWGVAGSRELTWDLRDERGATVPAGIYWARLSEDGLSAVRCV